MSTPRADDPCGVPCPIKTCSGGVVYNGSYFCDTCEWSASESWLRRHPEAYANLMDWRARRQGVPVEELTNFDQAFYDKSAL